MAGLLTAAIAGAGLLGLAGAAFASGVSSPLGTRRQCRRPLRQRRLLRRQRQPGHQRDQRPDQPVRLCRGQHRRRHGSQQGQPSPSTTHSTASLPATWTGTAEGSPTTFSPASSLPAGTPADIAAFAPHVSGRGRLECQHHHLAGGEHPRHHRRLRQHHPGPPDRLGSGRRRQRRRHLLGVRHRLQHHIVADHRRRHHGPGQRLGGPVPRSSRPTTTTLTTSATGGHLNTGNPITLTATVSPLRRRAVQFYDNGTTSWPLDDPGLRDLHLHLHAGRRLTRLHGVPSFPARRPRLGDETGAAITASADLRGRLGLVRRCTVRPASPPARPDTTITLPSPTLTTSPTAAVAVTVKFHASARHPDHGLHESCRRPTAIGGCTVRRYQPAGVGRLHHDRPAAGHRQHHGLSPRPATGTRRCSPAQLWSRWRPRLFVA